ncbi:MAG: hypothetical protein IPG39_02235 [Bacteroidetes bacterium]|nr:hypothetical protein [Bacteroidota bacterium]
MDQLRRWGIAAFYFLLEVRTYIKPMAISAPGTTNSAFIGQYLVDSMLVNTSSRDTTLGYIYRDRVLEFNPGNRFFKCLCYTFRQENHPIIDSNNSSIMERNQMD